MRQGARETAAALSGRTRADRAAVMTAEPIGSPADFAHMLGVEPRQQPDPNYSRSPAASRASLRSE
jgi:hypothetical protein